VNPVRGGYDNWEIAVLGFVNRLISAFPIGPTLTRVGIVGFSSTAWLEFGFDAYNNKRTLSEAVSRIEIRGGETHYTEVTDRHSTGK